MRASAFLPGFTGVIPGAKVLVAGEEVGAIVGFVVVDGGLDVELELDPERAAWVRTVIPPTSITYREA